MPSENLSRRSHTRVKKWLDEKQQRATTKGTQPDRIVSDAPEQGQPSRLQSYATVVEVSAKEARVSYDGHLLRARYAPSLFSDLATRSPVTVGDQVQITVDDAEQARIEAVVVRRSSLARGVGDATRRAGRLQTQLLAANIDQVIVVASAAEPPFRPRLIDRFLVAASRDALPTVLCVNKLDLGLSTASEAFLRGYANLGIKVMLTSTVTGESIGSLMDVVGGQRSLLTGHSGVGKSSLLNAMEPGLARRVGSVTQSSAGRGKGKHTTSSSRLIPLSIPNTFIVDTPGIRSLGIGGLDPRDLVTHFADIALLAASCEYHNCLHDGEQGCALPSATSESGFLQARWRSYRKLLGELG